MATSSTSCSTCKDSTRALQLQCPCFYTKISRKTIRSSRNCLEQQHCQGSDHTNNSNDHRAEATAAAHGPPRSAPPAAKTAHGRRRRAMPHVWAAAKTSMMTSGAMSTRAAGTSPTRTSRTGHIHSSFSFSFIIIQKYFGFLNKFQYLPFIHHSFFGNPMFSPVENFLLLFFEKSCRIVLNVDVCPVGHISHSVLHCRAWHIISGCGPVGRALDLGD